MELNSKYIYNKKHRPASGHYVFEVVSNSEKMVTFRVTLNGILLCNRHQITHREIQQELQPIDFVENRHKLTRIFI